MKEKIKKYYPILILIIVLVAVWWFQYRRELNYCERECYYIPSREPTGFGRAVIDKGDYWSVCIETEKIERTCKDFETQKQCIDYCLNTE